MTKNTTILMTFLLLTLLGLLSLDADEQNEMFLVCDGADEEAASAAVLPFFEA